MKVAVLVIALLLPLVAYAVDLNISITIPGAQPPSPPPSFGGGSTVAVATVVVRGYAYPDAILTFLVDNAVAGTQTVPESGQFSRTFNMGAGTHTVGVWARDDRALISPTVSVTLAFSADTTTVIDNMAVPPTIAASQISSGRPLTLFGSAYPASAVRVFNDIEPSRTPRAATADGSGHWNVTLDASEYNNKSYAFKANYQIVSPGIVSPFSITLEPALLGQCKGADLNGDGRVDLIDLSILLYYWNKPITGFVRNPCVDLNADGWVNLKDFSILMYAWTG